MASASRRSPSANSICRIPTGLVRSCALAAPAASNSASITPLTRLLSALIDVSGVEPERACLEVIRDVRLASIRRTPEGALAVEVEILDRHRRRLAAGADRERHCARAIGILAGRLIGEHVAIEVAHRIRRELRAELQRQARARQTCA